MIDLNALVERHAEARRRGEMRALDTVLTLQRNMGARGAEPATMRWLLKLYEVRAERYVAREIADLTPEPVDPNAPTFDVSVFNRKPNTDWEEATRRVQGAAG